MKEIEMRAMLSGLLLFAAGPVFAEPVALVGAKVVLPGGALLEAGTVVFDGARIVAAGAGVTPPSGSRVIDCAGKWVTPGLIDAFTQVGAVEIEMVDGTQDAVLSSKYKDPVRAALQIQDALDLRSTLIAVNRRHGLTAVGSWPGEGLFAGQGAFVPLVDGDLRAVRGPVGQRVNLGEHGALAVYGSRALAMARLAEVFEDTRLFSRDRAAYQRNGLRDLSAHRRDLEALVPVIERRMPLFISVARASDIEAALAFLAREKLRGVLVGAEEGWLVADAIARAAVPAIVFPMNNLPESFERRGARADNAARLAAAGVKIALGAESSHNARNLRFVAGNAVRAGLEPAAAWAALTEVPAELLGQPDTGRLAAGARADLVIWSGDPFEPASHAEQVFIAGVAQSTETRQTALRDRYLRRLGLDTPLAR